MARAASQAPAFNGFKQAAGRHRGGPRTGEALQGLPALGARDPDRLRQGPADAPVIFVGEQPGDQEDLAGEPFIGPAGKVFDEALAAAGIDRSQAYVTNAVKHFKFEPRGKRASTPSPTWARSRSAAGGSNRSASSSSRSSSCARRHRRRVRPRQDRDDPRHALQAHRPARRHHQAPRHRPPPPTSFACPTRRPRRANAKPSTPTWTAPRPTCPRSRWGEGAGGWRGCRPDPAREDSRTLLFVLGPLPRSDGPAARPDLGQASMRRGSGNHFPWRCRGGAPAIDVGPLAPAPSRARASATRRAGGGQHEEIAGQRDHPAERRVHPLVRLRNAAVRLSLAAEMQARRDDLSAVVDGGWAGTSRITARRLRQSRLFLFTTRNGDNAD